MSDLLSKPDDAHRPQLAAESRARLVMRGIWTAYMVAGLLTLSFYLFIRLRECSGVVQCGISSIKAVVWTFLWPFFWMFYTNGTG